VAFVGAGGQDQRLVSAVSTDPSQRILPPSLSSNAISLAGEADIPFSYETEVEEAIGS